MKRRLPHLSFFLPMLLVAAMVAPLGGPSGAQLAAAALYVGSLLVAMWLGAQAARPAGWAGLVPPPEVRRGLLHHVVLPLLLLLMPVLLVLLMAGAAWAADGYGYPEGYPVTGAGAGAGMATGAGMGATMQAGSVPLPTWGDPLSYLLTLGPYGALLYGAVLMGRAIEKISTMQITVQVRLTDEDRAAVREMGASIRNLAERSERSERGAG